MNQVKKLFVTTAFFAPGFVFAANGSGPTISELIQQIGGIAQEVVALLVGLAVFMVIWGILKYIINADDETARAQGRQLVIWGVIGIFAMVSLWGLVNILVNTFALDSTVQSAPQLPPITNLT